MKGVAGYEKRHVCRHKPKSRVLKAERTLNQFVNFRVWNRYEKINDIDVLMTEMYCTALAPWLLLMPPSVFKNRTNMIYASLKAIRNKCLTLMSTDDRMRTRYLPKA